MIINAESSNDKSTIITIQNRKIKCCPHCESTIFIKHGKTNGKQRYLCKDCNITFSVTTNTPLYHSRKPLDCLHKFTKLMLNNVSLRNCSNQLKINLKTAFSWRHKLLIALEKIAKTNKLKDSIEMRKIFIRENNKGQKGYIENSGKKVWVIVSSDSNDNTFAEPISLGYFQRINFNKLVYSKIHKKSYIQAFGNHYLKAIAIKHNHNKEQQDNYCSKELICTFIKNIEVILSKCRGVATKYLPHYFSLAKIVSLRSEYTAVQLLRMISTSNCYVTQEKLKTIIPVYNK